MIDIFTYSIYLQLIIHVQLCGYVCAVYFRYSAQ